MVNAAGEAPARSRAAALSRAILEIDLPHHKVTLALLRQAGAAGSGHKNTLHNPFIRFVATTSVSSKIKLSFCKFKIVISETRRGEKVRRKG